MINIEIQIKIQINTNKVLWVWCIGMCKVLVGWWNSFIPVDCGGGRLIQKD